jgi:hypothetical protein
MLPSRCKTIQYSVQLVTDASKAEMERHCSSSPESPPVPIKP